MTIVHPSGENTSESQPPGDSGKGENIVTPITTRVSTSTPTIIPSTAPEAVVSPQKTMDVHSTPGVTII